MGPCTFEEYPELLTQCDGYLQAKYMLQRICEEQAKGEACWRHIAVTEADVGSYVPGRLGEEVAFSRCEQIRAFSNKSNVWKDVVNGIYQLLSWLRTILCIVERWRAKIVSNKFWVLSRSLAGFRCTINLLS